MHSNRGAATCLLALTAPCLLSPPLARSQPEVAESARLFGTLPSVSGMRLSPDGGKISFVRQHTTDRPIALVFDLVSGEGNVVLASEGSDLELSWCDWANETRLLCGYSGVILFRAGDWASASRLVAVDADATDMKVLVQKQQEDEWAFHQDQIVDWLPDDPRRILMAIRKGEGEGVSSIDIYRSRLKTIERPSHGVWHWISNGLAELRVRRKVNDRYDEWQYRPEGERKWQRLHRRRIENIDDRYWPAGFGAGPNELLVFDLHEGRVALFREELTAERSRSLVFAHPEVDVKSVRIRIGRTRRLVGVSYSTDKPYFHAFDERVRTILTNVESVLPGKRLWITSESWDQRYYLVFAESDVHPGSYYRYDSETNTLAHISDAYPELAEVALSPMSPMSYPADDGTMIPAYLTLPVSGGKAPGPAVILPHGGPESRDDWGFDWLAQFLAHRGYAVLQSNFRGSGGYGMEWVGEGGFREWARAISDLEAGARALVEKGIANPDRLCIAGWNYGGYAALMSAIEHPERYRCVVSIAPVTDPLDFAQDVHSWGMRKIMKEFIGREKEVIDRGSALWRASELRAPVLLFHGEKDVHVSVDQSRSLAKALERADKDVELVVYDDVAHSIRRQAHRIDMLERIGNFLETHLAPVATKTASE
jgi:dipeptidyl aminopeptidase/acylaminoacyl peptidase